MNMPNRMDRHVDFTTRPEILGTFGVVTSTHWIASAVGMSILEKGGNAFDAAVATGFVLQVLEPHLNGPGGDMPAIIYSREERQGRGHLRARAGAGRRHHRALPRRRPDAHPGRRPAGDGHSRRLRRLDADAARLRHDERARRAGAGDLLCRARPSGAAARRRDHRGARRVLREGMADLATRPGCRAAAAPEPQANFSNPVLAETWKRIIARGRSEARPRGQIEAARDAFYAASSPRRSTASCARTPRSWTPAAQRHKGVLTADDMAGWQATVEAPRDLRLSRLDGGQDRPVGPGAGAAAVARPAEGFRHRGDGPVRAPTSSIRSSRR